MVLAYKTLLSILLLQIQRVPAYSDGSDGNIYNGDAKKSQELT